MAPTKVANLEDLMKQEHTIHEAPSLMKQEHTIHVTPSEHDPSNFNLPCGELLDDANREEYLEFCIPMYEASITGNWKAAEAILKKRPNLVSYALNERYDTALHIAASTEETKFTISFVEKLVNRMTKSDLEYQNERGSTAFSLASAAGNIEMLKIMAKENKNLHKIRSINRMSPLHMSASFGKHKMVKYLYEESSEMNSYLLTHEDHEWALQKCVECDLFDIALKIVKRNPTVMTNKSLCSELLGLLAQKPDAFNKVEEKLITTIKKLFVRILHMMLGSAEEDSNALKLLKFMWSHTIKLPKKQVDDILKGRPEQRIAGRLHYPRRILFVATEMGNTRFVVEILRSYPELIWKTNDDNYSIFHVAVMNRHHDIHNLIYEIGAMKDQITALEDERGNNMLHLVGLSSVKMRPKMSGASLLMQRELMWFKEVEKMLPPSYRQKKNKDGKTPYELFSEVNMDEVLQGLKWMQDCMVVSALIITVAFAAAFTVPGGNQENGIPTFIHGFSFLIFILADAISLFFSTSSLLVFLSILTSRHGASDFMRSLPKKLMIGLITLFTSVAAMMVTFIASFFVLYHTGLKWVPILIATFSAMPALIYLVLQFPMLKTMFCSMYNPRYIFKPRKRTLYNTNPRF